MSRYTLVGLFFFALCLAPASAQVTASFNKYGVGCQGPNTPPITIDAGVLPKVGGEFVTKVRNLPVNQLFIFLVGVSDKTGFGTSLPIDLGFIGAPGCNLLASEECLGSCSTTNGSVDIRVFVPPFPSLAGMDLYLQILAPDPTANTLGIMVSHGGHYVIGS